MDDGLLYRFDLLVRAIHRLLSVFGKTRILSIAGLFEEHFECPLRWELVFGHAWKLRDLSRVLSELPCFELEGMGDFFVSAVDVHDRRAFDPPKKRRVLRSLRRSLQIVPSEMLKRHLLLPPTHWTERAMEAEKEANDLYEAAERHVLSDDRAVQDLEDKARDSAIMYEQQARQSRKMQRARTMTQLHMVLAADDAVREVRKHYEDALLSYSSASSAQPRTVSFSQPAAQTPPLSTHTLSSPSIPPVPPATSAPSAPPPPPAPPAPPAPSVCRGIAHTSVNNAAPRISPVPPRGLPVAAGTSTFSANKVRSNALQQLPRARIGETKTRLSSVKTPTAAASSAKRTTPPRRSRTPGSRNAPACADVFSSARSPRRSDEPASSGRCKYGPVTTTVAGRPGACSQERAASSQSFRCPARVSPMVPKSRSREHRLGSEGRSATKTGAPAYPRTAASRELLTLVAGLSKMNDRNAPPVPPSVPPSPQHYKRASGGPGGLVSRAPPVARVRPLSSSGRENLSIHRSATRGRTPTGEKRRPRGKPQSSSWSTEKREVEREIDTNRRASRKGARADGASHTNGGADGTIRYGVDPSRQQRPAVVGVARGSGFSIRRSHESPRVVRTAVAVSNDVGVRSATKTSGPMLRHPDLRARPYSAAPKRQSKYS